ncbi:hypothetical protein FPHYL_4820 [Fusarium phyllophilum]|uniref:Protein kinase domain-containing protein n=1 Tax=Fusarium phyllophilum TaxID=47803 RepID=A0A8H5K1Z4_9HYPO|nr:hypothetical protein FPHYL_4820 [Fusarium phyllophilum]
MSTDNGGTVIILRLQPKLAIATTITQSISSPFTQTSKTKFKCSYDLYSLGVVLIEIGLWKQIDSFRPEGSHALAFKRHLEERVAPNLKFYTGEKYALAVLNCLDTSKIAPDGDEDWRLSDAFSRKVISELESCQA